MMEMVVTILDGKLEEDFFLLKRVRRGVARESLL